MEIVAASGKRKQAKVVTDADHYLKLREPCVTSLRSVRHEIGMTDRHHRNAQFRSVLLLFNLLAEFQRAAGLPGYREPATIRTQVLTCGAILGRAGRRVVIHLSESWGGLKTRIPLLDSILNWQIPTSPKLEPAPVT